MQYDYHEMEISPYSWNYFRRDSIITANWSHMFFFLVQFFLCVLQIAQCLTIIRFRFYFFFLSKFCFVNSLPKHTPVLKFIACGSKIPTKCATIFASHWTFIKFECWEYCRWCVQLASLHQSLIDYQHSVFTESSE